jgi:predicted amidohydrolase
MKVRAIQFSPALGNLEKNVAFHVQQIKEAVTGGLDLIVFPELSLSGYHLKDILYDVSITPGDDIFKQLEALSQDIDIVVGAPVEEEAGIIHNCALYFSGGQLLHNHRKVQLPNFGMFEESMIFKAGDTFQSFKLEKFPFTVGMIICREILFPVYAYLHYLQGVDFLIAISNSPYRGIAKSGMTSLKLWERLGEVYAIQYHQNYIFVNRCGFEDGIGFGGGSFFAQPGKGIVKLAEYFEDDRFDVDVSMADVRRARIGGNYYRDEKPDVVLKELNRILNA